MLAENAIRLSLCLPDTKLNVNKRMYTNVDLRLLCKHTL